MSELKPCPFLARLCSMDGQIIGYTCKGECANCPAEDAKDKEIERLKRELKLADSAAEWTCLKLESEVKKLKAALFSIANFGKGQPFKFRTKAEYIDNFRLIQKMAKDVLNKYAPGTGKMEE